MVYKAALKLLVYVNEINVVNKFNRTMLGQDYMAFLYFEMVAVSD